MTTRTERPLCAGRNRDDADLPQPAHSKISAARTAAVIAVRYILTADRSCRTGPADIVICSSEVGCLFLFIIDQYLPGKAYTLRK